MPRLWRDEDLYKDADFVKQLLVKAQRNAEDILEMTDGDGFRKDLRFCLPKEMLSVLVAALLPKADSHAHDKAVRILKGNRVWL